MGLEFRCFFFFNDTATTEIYTLSLHDALPIFLGLTQRQAVAILYVASSLSSAAGLVLALAGSEKSAIIVFASMFVVALIGASILGHAVPFKPTKT